MELKPVVLFSWKNTKKKEIINPNDEANELAATINI